LPTILKSISCARRPGTEGIGGASPEPAVKSDASSGTSAARFHSFMPGPKTSESLRAVPLRTFAASSSIDIGPT
jgi:hypothetical protein